MSKALIVGVLAVPESNSRLCRTHFGLDLRRQNCVQVPHAHQIVGRAGEGEDPIHSAHPTMANLAHERDRLQPPEALFDTLPLSLAHRIARVPRGAAVNRAAAPAFVVLRHRRRDPQVAALFHKIPRIKSFVTAHRHRLCAREVSPA